MTRGESARVALFGHNDMSLGRPRVNVLELSRWQFGITTVYHFLFVPITIGLAFLVAGF